MTIKKIHIITVISVLLISACDRQNGVNNNNNVITSNEILTHISNNKELIVKGKTISGDINFVEVKTNRNLGSVYIEPAICFISCVFEDSVYASTKEYKCVFDKKVVFNDCKFQKGICFQNAEFRDEVLMDLSKIEGVARFDGAIFRSKATFNATNFMDKTTFASAVFFMEASFLKSFFKRDCIFHFARFNEIAKFMESYFYGYTDFSQIYSSSILDFSASKFGGETLLTYSTLLGGVLFPYCKFAKDLKFAKNVVLGEIKLRNIDGNMPDISDNKMFSY